MRGGLPPRYMLTSYSSDQNLELLIPSLKKRNACILIMLSFILEGICCFVLEDVVQVPGCLRVFSFSFRRRLQ